MNETIAPLHIKHRRLVFVVLLLAFILALPAFIFYAMGYRYQMGTDISTFTPTGGLYVFTDVEPSTILLNDEVVRGSRLFRRASYIQAVPPGLQRLVVQSPGYDTWVKEVMVYPQLVTEIEAFNLPLVPQVRPIARYLSSTGTSAYVTEEEVWAANFAFASVTVPVIFATSSRATSTWRVNPEFEFIETLFNEKASTTALLKLIETGTSTSTLGIGGSGATTSLDLASLTEVPTSTVSAGQLELRQVGEEVVARALNASNERPHYFCARPYLTSRDLEESPITDRLPTEPELGSVGECRDEIVIDRQEKRVVDFTFYPDNQNLVLLLREDGLFVTEIDNRGWQNTQLLYPGTDLQYVIYQGAIFVRDRNVYFEVLREVAAT